MNKIQELAKQAEANMITTSDTSMNMIHYTNQLSFAIIKECLDIIESYQKSKLTNESLRNIKDDIKQHFGIE